MWARVSPDHGVREIRSKAPRWDIRTALDFDPKNHAAGCYIDVLLSRPRERDFDARAVGDQQGHQTFGAQFCHWQAFLVDDVDRSPIRLELDTRDFFNMQAERLAYSADDCEGLHNGFRVELYRPLL